MAKPKKTVTKSDAKTPSSDVSPAKDTVVSADKDATAATPPAQDDSKAAKTGQQSESTPAKPDVEKDAPTSGAAKPVTGDADKSTSEKPGTTAAKEMSATSSPSGPATTAAKESGDKTSSTLPKAADAPKAEAAKSTSATTTSSIPKTTSGKPVTDTQSKEIKTNKGADSTASKKAGDSPAEKTTATPPKDSPKPATASTPAAQTPAAPERKRSVFLPMVLGGAVAAGLGFAASEYDLLERRGAADAEWRSALEAQQTRIAELEARADEPPAAPDLSQVDTLAEELEAARQQVAALQEQLGQIDSRLTTVEKEPATGGGNEVAVAAFEREMEALRQSVAAQREEIEGLLENAQTAEEATAAAAEAARAQTALSNLNGALGAGRPYEAVLAELQETGVDDIPPALSENAASGVVTLANLQARFPEAARDALAAARAETEGEGDVGFTGFLKRQLGARSVAPREGTDPDAVLSRAEAAVRDGRLTDALAEIDILPETAQSAMSDWLADARARQAAETAADDLSQRLTAN